VWEGLAVLGLEFRAFALARQVLCHFSYTSCTFFSVFFFFLKYLLAFFAQAVLDTIFLHWEWQAHAAMPILTFTWKKVKFLRK
jgi:hypothetical protein